MIKMIKTVFQAIKLHAKLVIILLAFDPLVMVISTLSFNVQTLVIGTTLFDLIMAFRYEFFFGPLFIFLIGALYHFNDWIRLRRYEHREAIANDISTLVMIMSALFSSTVFLTAALLSFVTKQLIYPSFLSYSLVQNKPIVEMSDLWFLILFYLVTSFLGILYALLREWTNHNIFAAFLTISPFIIEEVSYSFTTKLFTIGSAQYPVHATTLLFVIIFLMFGALRLMVKRKDFYN